MAKGFSGFGICCECGDIEGPWGWHPGKGWICKKCEERVMDEWIDVKDAMPKVYSDIVFKDKSGRVYRGTFDRLDRFISNDGRRIEYVVSWKEDRDEL